MTGKIVKFSFFRVRYLVCFAVFFLFALVLSITGGFDEINGGRTAVIISVLVLLSAAVLFIVISVFDRSLRMKPDLLNRLIAAVCILSAIGVGIGYPAAYKMALYNKLNDFDHVYSQVYAKVISEPALSSSGKSVGMTVRVECISGDGKTLENPKSKFKVYLPSGSNVRYGMGISFKAELGRPEEKLGDFYYRRQLLSQGCYMSVYANSFSEYRPKETMWDKFCGVGIMIRGKVSEYADYILAGSEESGLLKGILIGDKNDFSENLYSDMSKSGFMHIAAVSGLHVSFLCALLGVLLSAFSKKIRIAVTVPVLILFASVAAFTPSVNRAVIMMSIFLFSYLLMKDPDPVTSLFTAALVLVAVNPYVVFNLSFILSFSATLSLLIFARPLTAISKAGAEKASEKIFELTLFKRFVKNTKVLKNNIVKSISWLLDAFLVPLACQIGVMPILAYYFERISIGSIVGNIIVIPSTMIVFVVGFINFLIYCIYPPLSGLLSLIIIRPFLRLIRGTAGQLSGLSYVPGLKMSLFSIIVYYILAAAFYYFLTFVLKKIKSATKNAEKL